MTDTLIGMVIELPSNWRTRLPRLSNQWAKAARQHTLCCPISADDIEASPDGTVEGCRNYLSSGSDLCDGALTLWFDRPEAQDFPRDSRAALVKTTNCA